ncbi:MAG: hypothetical protein FJ291_14315 [Planctomycetes bacterium]|nr:hypothetical protein [Planctomycetota bacterium]
MPREELVAEIKALATRHDQAACTLIAVHSFASAAEAICLAIETLAGYYAGSGGRTPPKASFLAFCRRYLPDLGRTDTGALTLSAPRPSSLAPRPTSCAEALYAAFRGGLFHDGERASGIRCVDDEGRWMLSFEADGSARLNVIPFHAQFERGLNAYVRDLARDASLAARAARRSALLAKPTFVTPRSLG